MSLLDQTREKTLIELATTRFHPVLRRAEMRVLHDSASSENLTPPERVDKWPVVRPAFIRWLATDPKAAKQIDPKGLRVYGATIPGDLDLEGCHVNPMLDFCCCEFRGKINIESAETRDLRMLDSSMAKGLSADGVIVRGPLFLQRIMSAGEIRLLGAKITSNLECTGAKLKAKGNALQADGAKIGGGVFLTKGFECEGEIRLPGAEITGTLSCNGAKLKAKGNALQADGAKIGGDVFLMDDFESEGTIRLPSAEIGGDLAFREALVVDVVCQNTVIKGDLIWQCIEKSEKTRVNLVGAKVRNLRDDKDSWPEERNLNLDGLVYEELTLHEPLSKENIKAREHARELPLKAKERIDWLMLQPPDCRIEPQPWMQLRDLLERKGDHKGAKYVLFRLRCLQAKEKEFTPLLWLLGFLLFLCKVAKHIIDSPIVSCRRVWPYFRHPNRSWGIAFAWLEQKPLRICYSIAFVLFLGWLVFNHAGAKGAIAPTGAKAYAAFTAGTSMPAAYPTLNPFVYTLENAVPLVKLGQDEKWAPDRRYPGTDWFTNYWFLMWSRWLLILSGWVQATVLVAALSERFKK